MKRIEALSAGTRGRVSTVPSGLPPIDAALPHGGLERGKVHEFIGVHRADQPSMPARGALSDWSPPLALLIDLARRTVLSAAGSAGRAVWIGPTIWPYAAALACAGLPGERLSLDRCLFVRAGPAADRLWAIDLALRSRAAAVIVADGSGFDLAATRRLQLAAEAGGGGNDGDAPVCLLSRPPWELRELSAAATRWRVSDFRCSSATTARRWTVELLRCKGMQPAARAARAWVLERDHATRALRVVSDVLDRPGAAAVEQENARRIG